MDPIERVLKDPTRAELEEGSVHVVASVGDVHGHASVKVPIEAIHGLHYVGAHRRCELGGFVSYENLPGALLRQPAGDVWVSISVWLNAPNVRVVLKQRLREERASTASAGLRRRASVASITPVSTPSRPQPDA